MQTNLAHAIVRLGYHGPLNFGITHGVETWTPSSVQRSARAAGAAHRAWVHNIKDTLYNAMDQPFLMGGFIFTFRSYSPTGHLVSSMEYIYEQ